MAKERKKSEIRVESEGTAEEVVAEHSSMKKKKKKNKSPESTGEDGEKAASEREKLCEGDVVKMKSKKKKDKETRVDSDSEEYGNKSKKKNQETKVDSEAEDDAKKSKKKHKKIKVDSEADADGETMKKESGGDERGNRDSKSRKGKRKRDDCDLVAEENTDKSNREMERKSEENKSSVDSEVEETSLSSTKGDAMKEVQSEDSEVEGKTDKDSRKDANEERKKKKKPSEGSEAEETSLSSTKGDTKKEMQSENSEVEEKTDKDSRKDANKERKKQKKKPSESSEAEETSLNSTKDAKKKSKEKKASEVSEAAENNDSTKDTKKKKKQSEDSEVDVKNNKNSTKDADKEKKKRKKNRSEVPEAEEKDLNSTKDANKKKQSEDSETAEDNKGSTKDAKKKRKKKQKCDEDVTTPSSKSTKKVKFSDQVEVFPTDDEEKGEEEGEEVELVRGKRFTKEEDAVIKKAVLEYIDQHALGDEGLEMVLQCQSHPQLKGCWKEIATALPWRPYSSVYYRAHTVFEEGSRGVWTEEDLELVKEFQKKHGNDWKTLADAMGKHRKHVKDAWRRIRLEANKGHWSREEYQSLFDLVNKEIKMKAFKEKHAKHGMLRDNIPWMAISDELGTRNHVYCCKKWYDQLLSPMVAEGIWANVDDYRLLEELMKLDAACIDDVDWDNLLEDRDGDACRKRWNQMVHHIGTPGTKTFAEQVEILSDRYCPDLAEDREDFDNRPYDPED